MSMSQPPAQLAHPFGGIRTRNFTRRTGRPLNLLAGSERDESGRRFAILSSPPKVSGARRL